MNEGTVMRTLFAMTLLSLLPFLGGCRTSSQGLVEVMRENGYTAMVPPSSAWELGTVVEVGGANAHHPFTFIIPSQEGVQVDRFIIERDAPDVSRQSETKYGLDIGVSVPDLLKAQLQQKGARTYSLAATGNKLHDLNYAQYVRVFDTIRGALPDEKWNELVPADGPGRAAYLSSLWVANTLEYEFFSESGGKLNVDSTQVEIPANLAAEWHFTDRGTLQYSKTKPNGMPIPVCLGFLTRPITRTGPDIGPGMLLTREFPGGLPQPKPGEISALRIEVGPRTRGNGAAPGSRRSNPE